MAVLHLLVSGPGDHTVTECCPPQITPPGVPTTTTTTMVPYAPATATVPDLAGTLLSADTANSAYADYTFSCNVNLNDSCYSNDPNPIYITGQSLAPGTATSEYATITLTATPCSD